MVASLFRNCGAYMGDTPLPPSVSNTAGYYEDRTINSLNNRLIRQMLQWPCLNRLVRPWVATVAHCDERCFWTAAPRRLREIQPLPSDIRLLQRFGQRAPFCYKDPRFNVTLPTWWPHLPDDTRFVVVFREPGKTVDSMLRDAQVYSPPLPLTERWAYQSWARNYRRLLDEFSAVGDWLFLHYNQVVDLEAVPAIDAFAETRVDTGEIDRKLSRAKPPQQDLPRCARPCLTIYDALCKRSRHDVERWQVLASAPAAMDRKPA